MARAIDPTRARRMKPNSMKGAKSASIMEGRSIFKPSGTLGGSENATKQKSRAVAVSEGERKPL
jgi:hypothetical protein